MGGLFAAAMRGGAMARSGGGGARARIISAPSGLVVPPAVSRGAGAGGASSGGGGRELSCVELVPWASPISLAGRGGAVCFSGPAVTARSFSPCGVCGVSGGLG